MGGAHDGEEVLPRRHLGLASATDNDVEIVGKMGQKPNHFWQDGVFRVRRAVGFIVKDVVQEDLESVWKVGERFVVASELDRSAWLMTG